MHRSADEVPVERHALGSRRGRGNLPARQIAKACKADACPRGDRRLARERSGEDGSKKNRNIGSSLDEPGPAQDFVLLQVLRQDRIFDRTEESGVGAHREYSREHQWDVGKHDAGAADDHDPNLGKLNDPDQPRLVVIVGELPR